MLASRGISEIIATRRRGISSPLVEAVRELVPTNRPTSEQLSKFKELFYTLVLKCTAKERQSISKLVAQYPYTPRSVALYFALHDLETATPVLQHSTVINEQDLLALIPKSELGHSVVIAGRKDLTVRVVHDLLSLEDREGKILETLRDNEAIGKNNKIADMLLGDVVTGPNRPPLPILQPDNSFETKSTKTIIPSAPIFLEDVPQPVETPLKEEITISPLTPSRDVTDKSQELLSLASRAGSIKDPVVSEQRKQARSANQDIPTRLLTAAQNHNHERFSQLVTVACRIPSAMVLSAIKQKDAGLIATILKSLATTNTTSARILMLLNPELGRNRVILRSVMDSYKQMKQTQCMEYLEKFGAHFDSRPVASSPQTPAISLQRSTEDFASTRGIAQPEYPEIKEQTTPYRASA